MSEFSPRLYLITPPVAEAQRFVPLLEAALEAADIASVLLRTAARDERETKAIVRALAPLVQRHGAALLVEGDSRLARRTGADGVHVEGVGRALDDALDTLKPDRIVGVGGLTTRDDAMLAGEAGADYVMFGGPDGCDDAAAVLETTTWWAEIFNVPCVAYVRDPRAAADFARAGADFIAVRDGLWTDPAGVSQTVRSVSAAISAVQDAVP